MELATERLRLREFVDDDWRTIFAIESIPEVARYGAYETRDADQSREFVRLRVLAAQDEPRLVFDFAITRAGKMIGRSGIKLDDDPRNAMLWFVLAPEAQGQGYATEAARAVLGFAFGELGLHRVFGECDPRNHASARVLAKLGMQHEAHLRENIFLKGEWCDTIVFGMLAREWRAASAHV